MVATVVAVLYDPNTGQPAMIIAPDDDKELDTPALNTKGLVQARIPIDVYKAGDPTELAKYVPEECIPHLIVTKSIDPTQAPDPDVVIWSNVFQKYLTQLLELSDDTRLQLHAARFSMDTMDVSSTLALLRDAGGIVLDDDDSALADTKVDDPDVSDALDISAAVRDAAPADKLSVATERAQAGYAATNAKRVATKNIEIAGGLAAAVKS